MWSQDMMSGLTEVYFSWQYNMFIASDVFPAHISLKYISEEGNAYE